MRRRAHILLLAIWWAASACPLHATTSLTLEQYKSELDKAITTISSLELSPADAERLRQELPESWSIADGGNTFTVPLGTVRDELGGVARDAANREVHRGKALTQLHLLRAAADEVTAGSDTAAAHAAANSILSQREFRFVKGQTWIQEQQSKLAYFLYRILGRILGGAAAWGGMKWVVYGVVTLIVVLFALWIGRTLLRGAPTQLSLESGPVISEKSASTWLEEARLAAANGAWRDAVHLAYWAGIASLESRGLWRPDRARTPREYLRLLGGQNSYFTALLALTRHFERIWYGGGAATAEDFSTAIGELEALGCR